MVFSSDDDEREFDPSSDVDDYMDLDDANSVPSNSNAEEGSVGNESLEIDEELYNILKNCTFFQGSFAFSSTYSAVPNPGLKIEGFDDCDLRLPVSSADAAKLAQLGDVSPFGRGEKTLVDLKVRSTRQIDAPNIRFENPLFSRWINGPLLGEICKTLAIDSQTMNPRLNLYKLLVYSEGDHFKAHRDTPKEEGMIGTAVIVLPGAFEGGVIKLSHDGEEKTVDFASDCKYQFGVAAWYSDVKHAVDEVTSGYRVALIFNLTVQGRSLSADNTAITPELMSALQKVKSQREPVAYSLSNKYSIAQRKLGFKGRDRYIISNIAAAIAKIGGISLACGDLEVKRSDPEEVERYSDDEDEEENPMDFMAVLWPTSESQSIVERRKEENLSWDDILKIVNEPPPSMESESEKLQINYQKVCLLMDKCITQELPDRQVREAGELVYSLLDLLPPDLTSKIEMESIFASAYRFMRHEKLKGHRLSGFTTTALSRLLRMRNLFREDLQVSFDYSISGILRFPRLPLTPKTIQSLLETYKDSKKFPIEWLEVVFEDHPNVNLLQDFIRLMETDMAVDLRNMLDGISIYDLHKFIISGMKKRFSTFVVQEDDPYSMSLTYNASEYQLYDCFGLRKLEESLDALHDSTIEDSQISRVKNYVDLLDEQPEPHRTDLLSLLSDGISIPLDKIISVEGRIGGRQKKHLELAAKIVEHLTTKPTLVELPSTARLRENVIEATTKFFTSTKPERPDFSLPAWNSPKCKLGSGCGICGTLNSFLRSETETVVEFDRDWEYEGAAHYSDLNAELSADSYQPPGGIRYEYLSELQVNYSRWTNIFRVTKVAERNYRDAERRHKEQVGERIAVFKVLQEPVDREGKVKKEVAEGEFVEISASIDEK
ncbi:hypothetical protein AA313_de0208874 [Arthrobotrys entomopaga]|nr:hypothetical protein AA313_de0208874 [Arthrobotrys entomopaga]